MPKVYKLDACYFDENKMAEKILTLNSDISSTMNRLIIDEAPSIYYQLLIKYLVHKNINKDNIKTIIRRHISLCIYKILSSKKNKSNGNITLVEKNKELDEIIKKISISNLLEVDYIENSLFVANYFIDLYNAKTYKEIKNVCLNIIEEYKEETWIKGILKIIFDYFYIKCSFADLKYINHTDLIISHSLFNDIKMRYFEFNVLESFVSNWKCTQPSNEDYKKAVLGHVINIIFENNNLDFNQEMSINSILYYKMMVNKERINGSPIKVIENTLYFMDVDFEKNKAFINKEQIKQEFDFEYNNVLYRFTKNGIIKK